MGKSALPLGDTVKVDGIKISAVAVTVTLAVASVIPAALARMVAVPAAAPVTATVALVNPEAIITVAGTVATAVFEELSVKVMPFAGAGLAKVNVRVLTAAPGMFSVVGEKLIEVVTCSEAEPAVKNGAEAEIVADPGAAPVSCGALDGCVDPAGIVMVDGATVTFVESELASVTVTPPAGAAVGNVTCKGVV